MPRVPISLLLVCALGMTACVQGFSVFPVHSSSSPPPRHTFSRRKPEAHHASPRRRPLTLLDNTPTNKSTPASSTPPPRYPWGLAVHTFVMKTVGCWMRYIMCRCNETRFHLYHQKLVSLIKHRKPHQSLLTYSNHASVWDDPGIWCALLEPRDLVPHKFRSILMERDVYSAWGKRGEAFFRGANCLPIRRKRSSLEGFAVLRELHARLSQNKEWCHMCAEGRILQPYRFSAGQPQLGKLRLGTAKLVASSPPASTVVIPIYHSGMHKLAPETPPPSNDALSNDDKAGQTLHWYPTSGNIIDVYVGAPLDFQDLVPPNGFDFSEKIPAKLLADINERLTQALLELHDQSQRDGNIGV